MKISSPPEWLIVLVTVALAIALARPLERYLCVDAHGRPMRDRCQCGAWGWREKDGRVECWRCGRERE